MAKMKRSEFKALVKECIREIMQEQINPMPMLEALGGQPQAMPQLPTVINPMDDYQMRLRQELVSQRAMQGQLSRQSVTQQRALASPLQQSVVGLSELAGLGAGPDPNDPSAGRRYLAAGSEGTGYLNPSDRLRQADPYAGGYGRGYNHHLDTPMGGSQPMRGPQPPQYRQPLLDPALDSPLDGGPMRLPDPNLMRNIFEDTARTTYAHQAAHGHTRPSHADDGGGGGGLGAPMGPADRAAEIVANHNPEDLFAGAQNWAQLAFR